MQPPVFYIEPESISDSKALLNEEESKHAVKVMRLTKGDIIIIVDGLGNAYRGELLKAGRKNVEINIHSKIRNFGEPEIKLTLAAGLSTNYKFDTVVEKGTELGVSRFVPLLTGKSKIKLDDPKRIKSKTTRYRKIAKAAVKQCRRSYIPEICTPLTFSDYMKQIDEDTLNLIFHTGGSATRLEKINFENDIRRVNLIVGPESGFSDDEMDIAESHGIKAVNLGKRILRTETAGFVVCGIVMNYLGEFS